MTSEPGAMTGRRARARRGGLATPSAFEAVTRAQLEAVRAEVAEVKGRVNGLIWAVVTAVVVDVARALLVG